MSQSTSGRHSAGLFDIRNIIGLLLVIYGVVLTVLGLVDYSHTDKVKTGGMNINLWSGVGMLVVGVLMMVWCFARPIVVDEAELEQDKKAGSTVHES